MTAMKSTTIVKNADEVYNLPRGRVFSIRLAKSLPWRDLHRVLYYTANREVRLTMRDGSKVVGVLDEAPGAFATSTKRGPVLWLRIPGRKTRKGVDPREISYFKGFRAPTLEEALTAFIYVNSSNISQEQAAYAGSVIRDM